MSPSLSLVEQKSQQADSQSDQQDGQHHPQRLAPPQQRRGPAVLVRLFFHGSAGSRGEALSRSAFLKCTVDDSKLPHVRRQTACVCHTNRYWHSSVSSMNSGMPTPAEGLHWNVMVEDTVLDFSRPQVESEGTITSRVAPEGRARVGSTSGWPGVGAALAGALNQPTFDVVLGFAGGADPAVVRPVEFDLADVGAHAAGQRVVGDARQLDVVDVAVAVGADVSRRLMLAKKR